MSCTSVIFKNPYEIDLLRNDLPSPRNGEVLIKTQMSAISTGTEMLVYRGRIQPKLPVDETISKLAHEFKYPLKYGYSTVGRVVETGPAVSGDWLNRMVFCFHPHESHYVAQPDRLIPIPADIDPEDALFLPNTESAVNFLMDGRPVIGEAVTVFGQGVVGLLTTALLAMLPLKSLVTLDKWPIRRKKSLELGGHISWDPTAPDLKDKLTAVLNSRVGIKNSDLIFELSGNPEALNQAVDIAGFNTRIVIGSWYGTRRAALNLGAGFHRNRIRFISSQVSTLAPQFTGRWSKDRRLTVAWEMIRRIKPADFITHRFEIQRVKEAYELLDERPGDTIQVVLTYE
ncbi:MAG: zinc-binding alcohol dehydrogenase [Desulfobacterales bacterium]|jgi:2-desacetyl-2-hydroxyethyl bacteriochlorophyllide A dehydrogenase